MASRREMEALITLAGRISPSLTNALRQTQRGIGGVNSSSNLMGKAMNKDFELASKAAAIGSAAVGAGLAYIAVKGTKLASDLTEVQNVVDTTFGENSKAVDAWSVTALKSFGLSELSAKQFSSTMGAKGASGGVALYDTVNSHMSDNTKHVTKDGAVQKGLNAEFVGGIHIFSQPTDPALITANNVTNNDIWINNTSGNEMVNIRVAGAWIGTGAVYK